MYKLHFHLKLIKLVDTPPNPSYSNADIEGLVDPHYYSSIFFYGMLMEQRQRDDRSY